MAVCSASLNVVKSLSVLKATAGIGVRLNDVFQAVLVTDSPARFRKMTLAAPGLLWKTRLAGKGLTGTAACATRGSVESETAGASVPASIVFTGNTSA